MKLLVYFLILANAIFLFLNWDVISSVATGETSSKPLVGETLVLKGEKQIPVEPNYVPPPTPSGNSLTGIISSAIDFVSDAVEFVGDIFSDTPQELPPTEEVEEEPEREITRSPPPAPGSIEPLGPPRPSRCYLITHYLSRNAALVDVDILNTYGVKAQMRDAGDIYTKRYRIVAKVRANLDTAKGLSDLLNGVAIRHTLEEDRPLGYKLVTRYYTNRKSAERTLARIKKLGFSATIRTSPNPNAVSLYELVIKDDEVFDWEASRRDLQAVINPKAKFQAIADCK